MQKVISINLNGNAYQLDESGYERLREYLTRAEQQLEGNPDRAEIMADLEQAIADKCQRFLNSHKTVVTASEVEQIVAEMGPVDSGGDDDAQATSAAGSGKSETKQEPASRRLYRIMDGAMIAGVCNGLAAHFKIDVTLVRIAFVVAALVSRGFGIVAYIVLMFVVPEANTPEARAAAAGAPLNAKDIIDRAKKQYAQGKKQWRRQWREQRRQWQQQGWSAAAAVPPGPPPPVWAAVLLPVFALAHVSLFLLMAAAMISLVNNERILEWELPPDVPVWAGALILLIGYQIAVAPLRAIHQWTTVPRPGPQPAWFAFWNAVAWLMGAAVVVWLASYNGPEIREFFERLPELFRDFASAMRDFFERTREAR